MLFVNYQMEADEYLSANSDLSYLVSNTRSLSPNIRSAILKRLEERFDVIICEEFLIQILYNKKYKYEWNESEDQKEQNSSDSLNILLDLDSSKPMGIYTDFRPTILRPKVWLCRERIDQFAQNTGIDIDLLCQLIYLHEVGHHIFRISDILLSQGIRRLINEGLANLFVYLVSDEHDRKTLEQMSQKQHPVYSCYRYLVEWFNLEQSSLFSALVKLINGDQVAFLRELFKYSLIYYNKTSVITPVLKELGEFLFPDNNYVLVASLTKEERIKMFKNIEDLEESFYTKFGSDLLWNIIDVECKINNKLNLILLKEFAYQTNDEPSVISILRQQVISILFKCKSKNENKFIQLLNDDKYKEVKNNDYYKMELEQLYNCISALELMELEFD